MHLVLERHFKNSTLANAYCVLGATVEQLEVFLRPHGVVESYAGGIDVVRTIRERAYAARGDERLFFVLDADALNWQSYPALLKLIEEPPRGRHFFLAASTAEAIPETIRSRAVMVSPDTPRLNLGDPQGSTLVSEFLNRNGKARTQWLESCAEDEKRFSDFLTDYEQWARTRPDAARLLARVQEVRASEHALNIGRKMCLEYITAFL